jgi:hypothetical protein
LLKDFAVSTATEDYFYIESGENGNNFTISGLDKEKAYKFYAFGSRSATEKRVAYYTMSGLNSYQGELQIAGTNLGGEGVNQNIANICESGLVYPDEEGTLTFAVSRSTGAYMAINALKLEEYTDVKRPQTFTSLTITGSAVEEGEVPMHVISPTDKVSNKFEAFLSLQSGKFSFKGVTPEGVSTDIGKGHEPGVVAMNSYGISAEVTGPVYIVVDMSKKSYTITPVEEWSIVGSVTEGGWNAGAGVPLAYQGKGVWGGRVKLTGLGTASDRARFNFIIQ